MILRYILLNEFVYLAIIRNIYKTNSVSFRLNRYFCRSIRRRCLKFEFVPAAASCRAILKLPPRFRFIRDLDSIGEHENSKRASIGHVNLTPAEIYDRGFGDWGRKGSIGALAGGLYGVTRKTTDGGDHTDVMVLSGERAREMAPPSALHQTSLSKLPPQE